MTRKTGANRRRQLKALAAERALSGQPSVCWNCKRLLEEVYYQPVNTRAGYCHKACHEEFIGRVHEEFIGRVLRESAAKMGERVNDITVDLYKLQPRTYD